MQVVHVCGRGGFALVPLQGLSVIWVVIVGVISASCLDRRAPDVDSSTHSIPSFGEPLLNPCTRFDGKVERERVVRTRAVCHPEPCTYTAYDFLLRRMSLRSRLVMSVAVDASWLFYEYD